MNAVEVLRSVVAHKQIESLVPGSIRKEVSPGSNKIQLLTEKLQSEKLELKLLFGPVNHLDELALNSALKCKPLRGLLATENEFV